uniref:ZP domain-containing protein n=1 Tax=Trichuris muris TaxID=70415 RepID=A0A5S6QAH5_TRIMR
MPHWGWCILTGLLTLLSSTAASFGNTITAEPVVECRERNIRISLRTGQPFQGRMFIRGNSQRAECSKDFAQHSKIANRTNIEMVMDYNACGTERIRSLSPKGVTYASTVVVQFHPIFITHGDRSFHIRCFYAELDTTVTSQFEVGKIPTTSIEMMMDPPKCSYTVRSNSFNGPVVRSAKVGDEVFHRWECVGNNEIYGMLVHSCYVEDQQGRNTEIVDNQGCSKDRDLLPDLLYNNDLGLAYAKTEVFKYPDYSFVHFKCQIKICNKLNEGCQGLSPPVCTRHHDSRLRKRAANAKSPDNDQSINIDVITPDILVIDTEVEPTNADHQSEKDKKTKRPFDRRWIESEFTSSEELSFTCSNQYIMFCSMISILSLLVAGTCLALYCYMRKTCIDRNASDEAVRYYFTTSSADQLTKRGG